eukprot:scaffold43612_cov99-Amphora_coffeaeformis.AAC.2
MSQSKHHVDVIISYLTSLGQHLESSEDNQTQINDLYDSIDLVLGRVVNLQLASPLDLPMEPTQPTEPRADDEKAHRKWQQKYRKWQGEHRRWEQEAEKLRRKWEEEKSEFMQNVRELTWSIYELGFLEGLANAPTQNIKLNNSTPGEPSESSGIGGSHGSGGILAELATFINIHKNSFKRNDSQRVKEILNQER